MQAVRKWLNGEAIPAGDKICILAKWLKASPPLAALWGKLKNAGVLKVKEERSTYGEDALTTLPEDFQRLNTKHKVMVCEIVRALLRVEKR